MKLAFYFTQELRQKESLGMVRGADRSGFNLLRKAWHVLGIVIPLAFYLEILNGFFGEYDTRTVGLLLLGAAIALILLVDLVRFRHEPTQALVHLLLGPLMKEEERHRFNAMIPYLFSLALLFFFFSKVVAVVASLFLMFGDPAAAIVGGRYGRHRFVGGKSVEGAMAFIVAGSLSSLLFLLFHFRMEEAVGFDQVWMIVSFVGAAVAAVAELYSRTIWNGLLDDNLYVPLAGALSVVTAGLLVDIPVAKLLYFSGGF